MIIGPGGKMIREIIEKSGAEVNIEDTEEEYAADDMSDKAEAYRDRKYNAKRARDQEAARMLQNAPKSEEQKEEESETIEKAVKKVIKAIEGLKDLPLSVARPARQRIRKVLDRV